MNSKMSSQNSAEELPAILINEKLHEWEKLENCSAPLSAFQRNTCLDLGDEVTQRLLPCSLIGDSSHENEDAKKSKHIPTQTVWQFLDLYSDVSNDWFESSYEKVEPYVQELRDQHRKCTDISEKIGQVIEHLDDLKLECKQVSSKTNPLFAVSEKLSIEQVKLSSIYEELNSKLTPFQKVESIMKRLDSSAIAVTSDAFLNILNDIDDCMEYFKAHESYTESSNYLMKNRLCLAKALTDVKSYIISVLDTCKSISSTVSLMPTRDMGVIGVDVDVAKGSKFVAQYGRFQNIAVRLKPLLKQLENRVEKSYEYECALEECLKYYVALRQEIIGASLKDSISQLVASQSGNYCSLLRSVATQLIYVSQDEDKLYHLFFSKPSTIFTNFLELVCSILYDVMRPLVIHVKHMETLAEFCSILRVGILQDHVQNNPALQPFGNVAQQLLCDVQERLVFRAHLYFKTDVLQFAPSAGDLAYPEKLEMMKNIAEEIKMQENASLQRYDSRLSLASIGSCGDSVRSSSHVTRYAANTSPADLHGMWYPTIRRTLICLSRLYRCVEKPVFQGLAQEAIACCCENVQEATQIICRTKSQLDGYLFQIKHLLILREQIAPFQVDFTATEMSLDFNQLKSAAYGLLQKEKLFSLSSNNAILEFILHGSPLLKENYLDSRKIVDQQLKNSCEAFIAHVTDLIVAPISIFLAQVQACLTSASNTKKTISIKDEQFGSPSHLQNIIRECAKKIKSFIPTLLNKMELYLVNQDTQFILYKPIKNNIVSKFAKLQAVIEENYGEEERLLIACPTPEQISVLLSSTILSKKHSTVDNPKLNPNHGVNDDENVGSAKLNLNHGVNDDESLGSASKEETPKTNVIV